MTGAEPDSLVGDGSDTCVTIDGSTDRYIFDAASGDCIAGCIDPAYSGFSTTPDGAITALGTFRRGAGPEPAWYPSLSVCTKWL